MKASSRDYFSPVAYTSEHGFTLIEVMVAVAVIAVALPALMFSMIGQLDSTAYLRDKMQAQWVAENQLAELRINNRLTGFVPTKKQKGEEELAGRMWRWELNSSKSASELFKSFYNVDVSVWRADDGVKDPALVMVSGLIQAFDNSPIKRPDVLKASGSGGSGSSGSGNSKSASTPAEKK